MLEFETKQQIAVLKEYSGDCKKELRLVSWNNAPAKYDIRIWKGDKPGKGITLDGDELKALAAVLPELLK